LVLTTKLSQEKNTLKDTKDVLVVPRHRLSFYGRRAFCVAGPSVWNSLPDSLRNPVIGRTVSDNLWRRTCLQRTDAFGALKVSRRCAI